MTVLAPARLGAGRVAANGLTVQVIEREEIEASGARTLQEALRRFAGVHLSDEQGNAFQQDLSMRGFAASPVTGLAQGLSVFLDGVRVNEPAVEEVNFDLVPLTEVERIEIVRGPNAVFGRNTLGGAIHVVTRRGGPRPEAEVELEGASWWHQEAHGRVAGPLGPLDGYLALGQFSERGWRVTGGSRGARAFGKLGLRRQGTDVALSYQAQVDRLEQPGSLPRSMLDADRSQNYTAGDFFRPELHLLTLNAHRQIASGLSLSLNAFFRALDAEQFNSSFLSPDTRLFSATRSAGGAVQVDHQAGWGALRNRVTAGAEAGHNAVRVAVHEEPNPRFGAAEDGSALPRLLSRISDGQVALGAFLQEGVRVAEGPLAGLGATATLRWDRISHDIVDTSPPSPGSATGTATYARWVPALGLAWAFAPQWLASASYSEGFRAPAFLELTCADPAAPCVGLQAGVAPDATLTRLRPVRSRSLEAGVTGSPLAGLVATAAAFRTDLGDDIYGVTPAGTNQVFFQNVGSTRRQGLELTLQLRSRILDLDAAYAYTRATFESDLTLATPRTAGGVEAVPRGAQLPLTPRHRLDLAARVRPVGGLTLEAGLLWVGSQFLRGDEANQASRLAPHAVARAGVVYERGSWMVSLRAVNLLDARYQTFGTYAVNGRLGIDPPPTEPFLTPGPPLRIVAGLRWELE
jgi:outer membrane receptor protein involved in Fe transport